MGAGLKHDAQGVGAGEAAAQALRLGGKSRLLDDLTGFVKNAHLDVAVAEIETHGPLRSLAGGSITHGQPPSLGPQSPALLGDLTVPRGRLAFSSHLHNHCSTDPEVER